MGDAGNLELLLVDDDDSALGNLAVELLKTDSKRSFQLVDGEVTDSASRYVIRDRLFREWAVLDPGAMSVWLLENSGQFDTPRYCILTHQWTKSDGPSALFFAQHTAKGEAKCFALLGVAESSLTVGVGG